MWGDVDFAVLSYELDLDVIPSKASTKLKTLNTHVCKLYFIFYFLQYEIFWNGM